MIDLYECDIYYNHYDYMVGVKEEYKINNIVYIDENFITTPCGKMFEIRYIDEEYRLRTIIDYERCFMFVPKKENE
jgi:hypothetical protein